MPALRADLVIYWEAFQTLSASRQIGLGIGAIPITEIVAYSTELGLEGEERADMLRFVRALDDEYIAVMNEKQTKPKRKEEPPPSA